MGSNQWSATKRRLILAKTEGRCAYCGCELEDRWAVEHVIPESKGGSREITNLVASCRSCNHIKCNRTAEELRAILKVRMLEALALIRRNLTLFGGDTKQREVAAAIEHLSELQRLIEGPVSIKFHIDSTEYGEELG